MSILRSRLSKIIEMYGQTLCEALSTREPHVLEARLSIIDLVLHFSQSDPTFGKSRTQWMVTTYIGDENFKVEDLGRAQAALAAFERFKRKLSIEQRELLKVKTLHALEALVTPFVKAEAKAQLERDLSSATGRELRRLEEAKARDESLILQEGEGMSTIAVPMTEFASKWWGRGTKWCTAAEKSNKFDQYHQKAPLIIVVCGDGAKFQAYVTSESLHFMDATDIQVTKTTIRERLSDLHSLISWIMLQNWKILLYLPEDMRARELWRLAIKQDGYALYFLSKKKRILEFCRLAVEQNGLALGYVPDSLKDETICRMAVQQNGGAMQYTPVVLRTQELCKLAMHQNALALPFVPKDKRTLEFCRLSVQKSGSMLEHVPDDKKTLELCLIAIKDKSFFGRALKYVPEENKAPKLCRLAVVQNGLVLQFVPEKYKTEELCRIAVQQDGWALAHVPNYLKSFELCCLAIQQDGLALAFVPDQYRTPELCRLINQHGKEILLENLDNNEAEVMDRTPPMQSGWTMDVFKSFQSLPITPVLK
jgi:Domain of unknown function (DUF4116)